MQANFSIEAGTDIYVSREQAGCNAPVDLTFQSVITAMPGVPRAVPRIVGRVYMEESLATVVGIADLAEIPIIKGKIPSKSGEALMGAGLARKWRSLSAMNSALPYTLL